ncbi:MAG: type II secretion system F family protein [Polyangiaceae bacterium]
MKLHITKLLALKLGGLALAFVGFACLFNVAVYGDTFVTRLWSKYTNYLDKTLRLLFLEGSSKKIVQWQGALIGGVLTIEVGFVEVPYWYFIVPAIAIGPVLWLSQERKKRIEKLELQVDGFILALANSMKTVPGPAAALQACVPILQNPTRQEIERVVKEMRVGNTLEQALVNMSSRIGSRTMDSALSSVLIGLQVGGNLPVVLETTAATIREMNRLEGVVRTKTGEGKAQLWVLAIFPFAICGAFNAVQPGYFDPLQKTFVGYIVITIALTFWIGSLLVARKVLTVDI